MSKSGRGKGRGGKVVPINGNAAGFVRLRALRCFKDVHQKLVDQFPLAEVARWIQNEQREYTDISKEGLVSILHKYRATIPPAELAKKHLTQTTVEALQKVEEGLDELAELQKLYQMQMKRIQIDLTMEQNIKKLLPSLGQEIRIAKEIIQQHADLKMDLGLVERNLGTTRSENVTATVEIANPVVAKVLENPETKRKLAALAQRFLTAAKQDGQPIPALPEARGIDDDHKDVIEAELVFAEPDPEADK